MAYVTAFPSACCNWRARIWCCRRWGNQAGLLIKLDAPPTGAKVIAAETSQAVRSIWSWW